jgi:hypothetical protein
MLGRRDGDDRTRVGDTRRRDRGTVDRGTVDRGRVDRAVDRAVRGGNG